MMRFREAASYYIAIHILEAHVAHLALVVISNFSLSCE